MRRSPILAGAAVVLAGGGLAAASSPALAASNSREYVVLYEKGASADAAAKAIKAAGGTLLGVNKAVGLASVRSSDKGFARDAEASRAIRAAAVDQSIGRADASRKHKDDAVEREGSSAAQGALAPPVAGGDPLSGEQWDMAAIGATPSGSYATQPGSRAVRVGIIDTGVDGSHPDIAPNFNRALSRNFTRDDVAIDGPCDDTDLSPAAPGEDPCADPSDVDEDGHGTHVASTIGSPVNGLGMSGVAPGVSLVNLRAGQDSGYFFLKPTVDALTYAGDVGIDVVNMSYYIDPWLFNCTANPADTQQEQDFQKLVIDGTQRALAYAHARGVTLVSAEGNGHSDLDKVSSDDTSPDYPDADASPHHRDFAPGSCPSMPTGGTDVIGVTSTGKTGRKAYYSDYGTSQADIAAPGGDSREFFGTPQYAAQNNKVLAAYPRAVGVAAGTIDATTGEPTTPQVVKDTSGGVTSYYQYIQGTSMASPHAAGVAALVVAARGTRDEDNGGLTLAAGTVERVLAETATDKPCPQPATFVYPFQGKVSDTTDYTATCEGTPARNSFFGEGLVNAVAAGTTPAPPPVVTPPASTPGAPSAPPKVTLVLPRVASLFAVGRRGTVVKRLAITATPGAKVTVTCKGPGCPRGFKDHRISSTGKANLAQRFAGRVLRPGARITIRVQTTGLKDRRIVLRTRARRAPLQTTSIG